jgi:tetratricopeptide (TPR) repeat protein
MGEYASPEQMMGRPLTTQSDLFSLGAVIYYALTGRKVIEAKSVEEILGQINAPVRPPSHLESGVPASLDAIMCKLLAKAPEARYQTAKDLLVDVGHLYATNNEEEKRALFGKVEDANLAWARRALVQHEYDKVHKLAASCGDISPPKKAVLCRLQGKAFRAQNRIQEGLQALEKAAAIQANDVNYLLDYVLELVRQGQVPQASAALQREFRSAADNTVVAGMKNLLGRWNTDEILELRRGAEKSGGQGGSSEGGLFGKLGSLFRGGRK